MSEPQHIREILPEVMRNIRKQCNKNLKENNLSARNKRNSRGFIKTCERRRNGKNVNTPWQKISWPGRENSEERQKN